MSDPLPLGKKVPVKSKKQHRCVAITRNNKILYVALIMLLFGSAMRLFDSRSVPRALADTSKESTISVQSPLFEEKTDLFEQKEHFEGFKSEKSPINGKNSSKKPFSDKIYALVGETPIKEMVPFISQRDQKVAAFLIGIAKKESSLGLASPSKDGKTCYNYWGYKGSGQRGVGMGYACFASPEEAVETVGDRIEVLVGKNRSTPSKMVDTWKCGTSCAGDPGAPGWVSTVALYFDKIVDQNI